MSKKSYLQKGGLSGLGKWALFSFVLLIAAILAFWVREGVLAEVKAFSAVSYCDSQTTDCKGKTVVISGANSGLGYYTAFYLSNHGANVIMGCRDLKRCNEAKQRIVKGERLPNPRGIKGRIFLEPTVAELDLASFASVRSFVDWLKSEGGVGSVDVLVNNAGLMGLPPPRSVTADGHETQFGVNHLGHFLLTALIYPLLSKKARIVNHSSAAAFSAPADFFVSGDYQTMEYTSTSTWLAYGQSKLANLQFTYELNDRLAAAGNPKEIVAIAVHPGYTNTELQGKSVMKNFGAHVWANSLFAMSLADGSISQILAAVSPNVLASNNTFFGPKFVMFGFPESTHTGKYHKPSQKKLWEISEELTGTVFLT
jgi:NAD(P)-dependent dehydrogenase (short-subunit alcohol dehydrogenase family)